MSDEITLDGEIFVSSKRASGFSGYQQDYIGQLARGGQIQARRVGGLWYISSNSLKMYMERAESYQPVPPVKEINKSEPDSLLSFDGRGYISASRASKLTGYSSDYVGQMARAGVIPSRQVGNRWYVEQSGILKHKESKDALLGAVQAQSVGLKTPTEPDFKFGKEHSITTEPFFQYTSDDRDLTPVIKHSNAQLPEDDEMKKEEHIIPIRVHYEKERIPNKLALNMPLVSGPRLVTLPMVLSASLFTIVIVLSLGFISLKESSVYTVNSSKGVSKTARLQANQQTSWLGLPILNSSAQMASVGVSIINKIADRIEPWIAPELIYRRAI